MKKITLTTMFYLLSINCHWIRTLIGAMKRATLQIMAGGPRCRLVVGVDKGVQFNSRHRRDIPEQ